MKRVRNYELFDKVLEKIYKYDNLTITFTPKNVAEGDNFLIFSSRKQQNVTFHLNSPCWLDFDGKEPILLEEVPDSFLESILLNLPKE